MIIYDLGNAASTGIRFMVLSVGVSNRVSGIILKLRAICGDRVYLRVCVCEIDWVLDGALNLNVGINWGDLEGS